MAEFDQTVFIAAPAPIVWREVRASIRQPKRVVFGKDGHVLISQDDDTCHIFLLEPQTNKSTRLRYLMSPSFDALALPGAADISEALMALPTDIPEHVSSLAADRLRQIEHSAYSAAHYPQATTSNDVSGVVGTNNAPFRLGAIIFGSFFLGSPGGSIMTAINWKRFGREGRFWSALVLAVIAPMVILFGAFVIGFLADQPMLGVFMAGIVLNTLFGVGMARWQKANYQAWIAANGDVKPSRRIGCMSIIGLCVSSAVIGSAADSIFSSSLLSAGVSALSFLPPQTVVKDGIALAYPRGWVTLDFNADVCGSPGTSCLLAIAPMDEISEQSATVSVDVLRYTPFLLLPTAAEVDDQLWTSWQQQSPSATPISRREFQIDSHTAVERVFQDGQQTVLYIVIEDRNTIIRFWAGGDSASFRRQRAKIDAIVQTIHVTSS